MMCPWRTPKKKCTAQAAADVASREVSKAQDLLWSLGQIAVPGLPWIGSWCCEAYWWPRIIVPKECHIIHQCCTFESSADLVHVEKKLLFDAICFLAFKIYSGDWNPVPF